MPRAYQISPDHPAVDYLVRLHGDLGGQIDSNRKEAKPLAEAMKHVEAVIKLFDPAYNVSRIAMRRRNRKNKWFPRGTMVRAMFDVLKAAEGPLTTREITVRVLAARRDQPHVCRYPPRGRRHPR